jgi:hypothetical protein
VSVGRDKPGLVGGRVDVMKTDLVGAGVSSETLTQEPRLRLVSRTNIQRISIQIFFIRGFYLVNIKAGATELHRPSLQWKALFLCKDQGIEAIVIEERISHADFSKGGAHQVLAVTQIGPVVDPPVDYALTIKGRIIAIDIL